MGISPQLLSFIEKGDRPNPTMDTLLGMSAAYGLSIDELVSDEIPTPPELQKVLQSGVFGDIELEEIRKMKRANPALGVELVAEDYVHLLGLIRRRRASHT